MLPSSHNTPIISPLLNQPGDGATAALNALRLDGRTTDTGIASNGSAMALAEAFAEFVATSSRLEDSYRQLQGEVSGLRVELAERNAALKSSLSDNQRVRLTLQQTIESMPCGVLVADTDGRVSTINPETARVLGLSRAPQSLTEVEMLCGLKLAGSTADVEQEFCLRTAEGERWLQIRNRRLAAHETADGKNNQTIFILRDVTAHKRAERDREAGRSAMALAEITTMLAHEIRNPLASLELFAELVETDDARRPEWVSNLRAGIRQLSGTVNNVLSLHNAGELKLAPVSFPEVVCNTVRFMQPLADQAGVTLGWVCQGGDLRLLGNEGALQQVLLNFVTNAIRHTPPGGSVTVALRNDRYTGKLVLDCTDTGSGIRADQIGRLFEPGFSGSGDTPGLGLAVCDRIIRQHNGTVSVFNQPGAGACFHIEFPVFQQESVTA